MKRKVISSLLALMLLVFASPSWAFVCAMPCKMSQKQMIDCARACSSETAATSIGHRACVSMQVQAQQVFTAVDAQVAHAPEFLIVAVQQIPVVNFTLGLATGQPLRGPPHSFLLELPTANAPPQLI